MRVKHVSSPALFALALGLGLAAGCQKKNTDNPEAGSNLLGPTASSSDDEDIDDFGDDDEFAWDDEEEGEEGAGEEEAVAPRKKLPKRAKASKKCKTKGKGKDKKKVCKYHDPKPKVSASHGVYALLGDFRWGMTTKQVFKVLGKDIEAEYTKRQKSNKDAMSQDTNRQWRKDQLQAIKSNHTKFTAGSKHRWGVSLIQFEYEDDNNEEMLWVRQPNGLRKFYFFKDGELWKIFYAYSTDVWPGKSYDDVVDEKFKKWFGPSPKQHEKKDKEGRPQLIYLEWTSMEDEKIRSFDMTQVHGAIGLAVVDGRAEGRIGQRLPNIKEEEGFSDTVSDVLGGSDVCYNSDGTIRECSEKEALNLD